MSISVYASNRQLDNMLGKAQWTAPTIYVGVSSTPPTTTGTNITPPTTGGYVRYQTSAATWTSSANGATSNALEMDFVTASADWLGGSNLTYLTLHDAAIGGNMIASVPLAVPRAVLNGQTFKIPVGGLTVSVS